MLKTDYLTHHLWALRRVDTTGHGDDDRWLACYADTKRPQDEVHGRGHTPEAAMAEAQKQIKLMSERKN